MTTPADKNWPEIDWEITGEVLDRDPEEREVRYLANGFDATGQKYTADAIYVLGKFERLGEIELL